MTRTQSRVAINYIHVQIQFLLIIDTELWSVLVRYWYLH